jgi:hypothetical protein
VKRKAYPATAQRLIERRQPAVFVPGYDIAVAEY